MGSVGERPRARGQRAGLTLERIVDAAREMDPATLTMQAVADRLQVNRKAVSYHVSDRESLLNLVATNTLIDDLSGLAIAEKASWDEALRTLGRRMKDALCHAPLGEHAQLARSTEVASLGATEVVLEKLIAAGFDPLTAGRSIGMVGALATQAARDFALAGRSGELPIYASVRETVSGPTRAEFPALAQLVESSADVDNSIDEVFEMYLTVCVGGLAAMLAES